MPALPGRVADTWTPDGGSGGTTVHNDLTGRDATDTHPTSSITGLDADLAALIPLTQKGAASGVATLDSGSKIPAAQIPAIALSEFLGVVASEAAMLALVGQRGDWAIRSDFTPNRVYILESDDPTQAANWTDVTTPGAVISVDGRVGAVTLGDLYAELAGAQMTGADPVTVDTVPAVLYVPIPDLNANAFVVKGVAGIPTYGEGQAFVVLKEGPGNAQDTSAAGSVLARIGTAYGEIGTQGGLHIQLGARKAIPGAAADKSSLWINPDIDSVGISIGMKVGAATQPALQLFGSTAPMASVQAFALGHLGEAQWFLNNGSTYGAAIFPQDSPALGVRAHFAAGAAAIIPLYITGAAGQTGDLQRWANSVGTVLGSIDSAGRHRAPLGALATVGYGFQGDPNTGLYSAGADAFSLVAGGTAKATVDANGLNVVSGWILGTGAASGIVAAFIAPAATDVAIVARAAASQTADIQQWQQNTGGTVLLRVNKAGYLVTKKVAAPADADLNSSELTHWLDATAGDPQVRWKMKDSGGTVKNITVPQKHLDINAQTGTTYTPVLADDGRLVTQSNASPITTTLPQDSDVAYPIGTQIHFAQIGAGQVTFAAGTGATVNAQPGLKIAAQYGVVTALKRAANTWLLMGALAA